jgi:hypothetical protein
MIKLRYSTIDRFSETRTFKTLKGAQKYAHGRVGASPEISRTFGYAVDANGIGKVEIREGATLDQLFPSSAEELEQIQIMEDNYNDPYEQADRSLGIDPCEGMDPDY